jgi:hypothetical protein
MKTFKEMMEEMSGSGGIGGGPTNVTGANIAGTTPDTVGVRPQNIPKRKKLPKSPVIMKLKRNVPNDFK